MATSNPCSQCTVLRAALYEARKALREVLDACDEWCPECNAERDPETDAITHDRDCVHLQMDAALAATDAEGRS